MLNSQNPQNYLVPAALIGGIVTVAMVNQAVNALHAWWIALPAFTEMDKERHRKLQEIYRKMRGRDINYSPDIPDFWKLDTASRPTFKLDLGITIAGIRDNINEYEKSSTRTARFTSGLLEKFSAFLDSIKKHNKLMDTVTYSALSKCGVEAMFLGEMISWVSSSLCRLELESDSGLKILKARIEYCREITNTIPIENTYNDSRPSFKSFLEDLVSSMDNYYHYCQSQQDARTLNKHIEEVENEISILTRDMTKLVMALNINSDYTKDNFDLFMNPPISNYPKIKAMRNSGLGNWLYIVMCQMGVLNTVYHANHVLTVKEIEKILVHQHPYDTAFFYKDGELQHCNNSAWGHRSFVLQLENSEHKAAQYSLIIREIIRGIAWLFFAQKNLNSLKIIASGNGLIWVYGSPLGKALLSETIKNIEWILDEKIRIPLDLLSKDYINDGVNYCKKNRKDYATDEDYPLLTHLQKKLTHDEGILGSAGHLAALRVKLKNIVEIANNSLDMKEKIRKEQAVLLNDLLDTFKLRNNNCSKCENFITLKQALEECLATDGDIVPVHWNKVSTDEQSATITYYNFHYPYDKLPHYNEAVRLLNLENDSITEVETINHDLFTNKYGHHASLVNIYMRFIQFYLEDVSTRYKLLFNTDPFYAFFMPESWVAANTINLPRKKIPDLRKIWFSINNVFKYLMSLPAVPEIVELELVVYVIKEKLRTFYLKHHEIPAILLGFEMMWQVERSKDSVDVRLNNFALSLTNSAIQLLIRVYIEKIEKLEQQLEEKERELKETKDDLISTRAELKDTRAELKDTKAELKDTKAELEDTKAKSEDTKAKSEDTK
ncbi:MAG: hypothetical protein C0446_13140, partial [Chitinophaga sp.]|nr:hypothetical protein [Chitinophaga sp.]